MPQPPHAPTPESYRACGLELRQMGRLEEAVQAFQAALRLDANYAPGYYNIASIRLDQGRIEEAAALWRQAIQVKPGYYHAHAALGVALRRMGRIDEAIDACRSAIAINPDFVEAHLNLATALHAAHRMREATEAFEHALRLAPRHVQGLNNYAGLLADLDHRADAIEKLRAALAIEPDRPELLNNLANIFKSQGDADQAIDCYHKTLALRPGAAEVHSNLLLTLNCHPRADEGLLKDHTEWAQRHVARFYPKGDIELATDRSRGRPLRVGYVSSDFRKHAVSYFFEPIIRNHDRSRAAVICYSDVAHADETTARLRGLADQWREITGLTDDRVAQLVREDRIDILVDLSGHTARNRLGVFARRAAPVQVTYLGYPNTTGLATMDYRITDAESDPPGMTEGHYTEKLIRLPQGFLCYGPAENCPEPRAIDGGTDRVTFGTFNNFAKVTGVMLRLWSRILLAAPNARLLIKAECLGDQEIQKRICGIFAQQGVDPARVELLGREPSFVNHLATYHRMEIALDTFPYHGTTTTCEAMWMGVPVVTLAGRAHVSRVGVSLLKRVGMDELIAQNPDQYVSIAAELARNHLRRREISGANLRQRMKQSPLLDAAEFTASLEAAYRHMWQQSSSRP